MKKNLKNVTAIAVLSTGVCFGGCVASDDGAEQDRDAFEDTGVVSPEGLPPPTISEDPDGDGTAYDPTPAVFASKQVAPANLTVHGESLYWTEFDGQTVALNWMHTDGGDVHRVQSLSSLPFDSAVDDSGVYFSASSQQDIVFAPHLGLSPESIFSSASDPLALELSEDHAYWTSADGCLQRGSKEGGDPLQLACAPGVPVVLSLAGNFAYWGTIDGTLYRSQLDALGAADKVASDQDFSGGLVADESGVYWGDAASRELRSIRNVSGEFRVLASAQYDTAGLSQDRFYLYYTSQGEGSVRRVLKTGGTPDLIASGQAAPSQIVASSEWLYWINEADGTVMRQLKDFNY